MRSVGMSIFSRTRDIFAANMTELLDRSEDPSRMIRMIILEMEETLVEVRASAARAIADGKEMRRAWKRLDELQASWTEKAELALSKDREDLAKAALIERQKAADMAEGLKAEIAVIDETLKAYEADIAKLQAKLREARARQNAIASRFESAVTRAKTREIMNGNRTEDAFSRFELLERRADFAEGRADALGIGSLEDGIDPTFIRIAWVAIPLLTPLDFTTAIIAYAIVGIYLAIQKKGSMSGERRMSDFDRMEQVSKRKPTVHAMRTELDETDRRLMAIDDHLATPNHELAREIEALREDK